MLAGIVAFRKSKYVLAKREEREHMQDNGNLSVLVIDPNPGMRSNLQNMLNASSISKVEYAVNSGTAVRQLTRRSYDIILCEYDLGGAGSGGAGDVRTASSCWKTCATIACSRNAASTKRARRCRRWSPTIRS